MRTYKYVPVWVSVNEDAELAIGSPDDDAVRGPSEKIVISTAPIEHVKAKNKVNEFREKMFHSS